MSHTNYSRAAQGGAYGTPAPIVVCDTPQDVWAVHNALGMTAVTLEHLPSTNPTAPVVLVSNVDAHSKAIRLISGGIDKLRVGFVDLAPLLGQPGHSTVPDLAQSNPDYLLGLIERPGDPYLHMIVRPLPEWEDRAAAETFGCGDGALADNVIWAMGSVAVWTGGYGSGKSTVAVQMAMKQMLAAKGLDAGFGASFCCFEDDLLDMKERSTTHFFKGRYDQQRLAELVHFQHRLWWYDERLPRPKGLDDWIEQVRHMTLRHGVRIHILDPWTAHLPDFEKAEQMTSYVNRMMNRITQLARELNIIIHIITHTPKAATPPKTGKPKMISVNDAHGSGDFGKFASYGFTASRTNYLAKLISGEVEDDDISGDDIARARAGHPVIQTNDHLILNIDKIKREGAMGERGVFAFKLDKNIEDIVHDPAATAILRKLWGM